MLLFHTPRKKWLAKVTQDKKLHTHLGIIDISATIGMEYGSAVRTTEGKLIFLVEPTIHDFIMKSERRTQIVYPKDLGYIVMFADVAPGMRVLEAGTGSGALTMALCRAVGGNGRVVTYERRDGFQDVARKNIEGFFGSLPPWLELRDGDVVDAEGTFDRVMLDLPDPWRVIPALERVLRPGGVVCAYLPTTQQVQSVVLNLELAGFAEIETFEILLRSWHVSSRSIRPDHRMVGHTGFIITARRAAP